MSVLVKAILICMTLVSVNGDPSTSGASKCIPIEENITNAINEEAYAKYGTVRTLFFTNSENELGYGELI